LSVGVGDLVYIISITGDICAARQIKSGTEGKLKISSLKQVFAGSLIIENEEEVKLDDWESGDNLIFSDEEREEREEREMRERRERKKTKEKEEEELSSLASVGTVYSEKVGSVE